VSIKNEKEGLNLIELGESNRKYGQTNMNARSSRSHTIFRVIVETRSNLLDGGEEEELWSSARKSVKSAIDSGEKAIGKNKSRISYLNIVDLAGSERQNKTGTTGTALKEGSLINRSLLTLNAVISSLSKPNSSKDHVPYRDSKLTRILKHSLGGNSFTAGVLAISPASIHAEESTGTLNFGSACKKIANKAIKNEVKDHALLLKQYKMQIEQLQHELETVKQGDNQAFLLEEHKNELQNEIQKKDATLKMELEARLLLEEQTKKLEKKVSILQDIMSPKSVTSDGSIDSIQSLPVNKRRKIRARSAFFYIYLYI
jgi:centromeric protein E